MESVGRLAQVACIWEVTARKPGNVHRFRDFVDVGYLDFLVSAAALGPILDRAGAQTVGATILEGIQATRRLVRSNTNLGILLLLSPLAAVPDGGDLRTGVAHVLAELDIDASRIVYEAIRTAAPGGLGKVQEQDVCQEPTLPLQQIMALAAGRDLVARQYADGFAEVFNEGVPALKRFLERTGLLETAIIGTHLHLLARFPDSLIARKMGPAEAETAARRAGEVLALGWPESPKSRAALADLDSWLCAEGNRRNPGTTADLVTASLFAALRTGIIPLPSPWPWCERGF
jgi:triphosphoribosyl-dephospho-CoA synthase